MELNKLRINNKKRKRAQMEMIGIAIVVVLLVIGMAFVFRALTKPPKRTHEKFTKEQTAQSILIAIGRSDAQCLDLSLTELMQDCAASVDDADDLEMGQTGSINCGTKDSCLYVNSSLKWIFDNTLKVQRLPYRFRLYKSSLDNPILKIISGGCNEYNIRLKRPPKFDVEKPGELTLPLSVGGTVNARLDICTLAGR